MRIGGQELFKEEQNAQGGSDICVVEGAKEEQGWKQADVERAVDLLRAEVGQR